MRFWWTALVVLRAPEGDGGAGGGAGGGGGAGDGGAAAGGAGGGAGGAGGAGSGDDGGRNSPVPYARFAEVLSEKNHFKKQLDEMNAKLQAHEGNATKLSKLEKEFESAKNTWAEERAFIAAGITDAEAMEVARLFYGRLEQKPEGGLAAWLTELKADPSKAPKALVAYIATEQGQQQTRAATTTTVRQTGRQQPAGEAVTADAMKAARERAMESGDWTEFHALNKAFKDSVRKG